MRSQFVLAFNFTYNFYKLYQPQPKTMIQDQLDNLRKDLLDITLRNRQLKLVETKARGLTISDADSAQIVQNLCESSRKYLFLDKQTEITAKTKLYFKTDYTELELQKRLATTQKEAKSFIEEQGINTLFLTVGALEWYDSDSSDAPILSPLLLLGVSLDRKTVQGMEVYELVCTEPDVQTNTTLQVKMKELGLEIPDFEGNDVLAYFKRIEDAVSNKKRWRVLPNEMRINLFSFQKLMMYNDLGDEKWLISDNYFIKTLLEKNGDFLNNGTEMRLSDNDNYNDADFNFDTLPISAIDHVLDADSSQAQAIERVFKNKALVIQGPPGTGKSQTIVNIIASCMKRGKTVLFVAEKLAALQVVRTRLDKVGLGAACLELHSHKANVKTVLKDINDTIAQKSNQNVPDYNRNLQKLDESRAQLNEYSTALHSKIGNTAITPHQAMGEMLRLQNRLPDAKRLYDIDGRWSDDDIQDRYDAILEVSAFVKENGLPCESPFEGTQIKSISNLEKTNLKNEFQTVYSIFFEVLQNANAIATHLNLEKPQTIVAIKLLLATAKLLLENPNIEGVANDISLDTQGKVFQLFDLGTKFHGLKAQYKDKIMPEAHTESFDKVKQIYEEKGNSWFARIFNSDFKNAKRQLQSALKVTPNTIEEAIELAKVLVEKRECTTAAAQLNAIAKTIFTKNMDWHFENDADWLAKKEGVEYVFKLKKAQATGKVDNNTVEKMNIANAIFKVETEKLNILLPDFEQKISHFLGSLKFSTAAKHEFCSNTKLIAELEKRINNLNDRFDDLNIYCEWNGYIQKLNKLNCVNIYKKILNIDKDKIDDIIDYYKYAVFAAFYDFAETQYPILMRTDMVGVAAGFCRNDKYLIEIYNTTKTKYLHLNSLPSLDAPGAPMRTLQTEMGKKRGHLSLQKLMKQTGDVLTQIKPVFMMSPLSVAQYLQTENLKFDYVIFDEASQVKPIDAFGALLRAHNVVVVGDSKQLPPSNFFGKTDNDDTDNEDDEGYTVAADTESILDLFGIKNARQTMLEWHYRSKHESLIAVSNQEFYDNRLITLPSAAPDTTKKGMIFKHFPNTHYAAGKNEQEAMHVIEALREHSKNTPEKSIGIVAFGTKQRDCIDELLRKACKIDADFRTYIEQLEAEEGDKAFFIKNLENVQGDERDVIFVSICYGKTPDGRLAQRFGPINQVGGERRLNVLFTRAKEKCVLFSNFTADDLRINDTDKQGLQVFKAFLEYAEKRRFSTTTQTGKTTDSPFEDAVKAALEREGFMVDIQIGSVGYRIDLAIPHPTKKGRYLLGIECDGASYHSSKAARDRDRLRQGVLEGLGWHIYRIWSTDWFRNPKKETEKLVAHIRNLVNEGTVPKSEEKIFEHSLILEDKKDETMAWLQPYQTATVNVSALKRELADEDTDKIIHIVSEFVQCESPVHQDYLKKVITEQMGIAKIGNRIAAKFDDVFRKGERRGLWKKRGNFVWQPNQGLEKARDRKTLAEKMRGIDWVVPEEIQLALHQITLQAIRITKDDLMKTTLNRLNGGERLTAGIQAVIEVEVDNLIRSKKLKMEMEMITAA